MTELPPPPQPQPQGWSMPAPLPPTPRKSRRTLFIVLGIVLVLCCCGGIGSVVYLVRSAVDSVAPVKAAADSFFKAVVDGSDAYGQLCSAAQSAVSREQFELSRTARRPRGYEITGTNVRNVNGKTSASVTVQLHFDGGSETHLVPLVFEGDTWKVCGRPY